VTGVFAEYQGSIGGAQWSLSARHDDNRQFGKVTTGGAAWGYHFAHALTLMASYGSAFRAPSFDDLYFPGFGNPNLRPETSRSAEVGVEQRSAGGSWSLHAFDTRVHELISFDSSFIPQNTDQARIQGIEAQGTARTGPWTATLTATWLDPRNRTPDSANFNHLLPGRARETARLELGRQLARWRLTARLNAAGRRFDDLANSAPLAGYTTLDALLEWAPSHEWAVLLRVANLTDRHYELALYYPQDGRNYLLTVRYAPLTKP
jgi:vitamin B12 transporter